MQAPRSHAGSMIDFPLYRLAWIPAAIAVVVLMFSFAGAPDALEPTTPPANLEGDRAANEARRIANRAPDRTPGGAGDQATADYVAERFSEIPAGLVVEQEFETSFDGEDVTARNVWLTLPGDEPETIVVLAPRDSAAGPAVASSAAATAVLLELASSLGVTGHTKTFVLGSTSGGVAGAEQLLEELPDREAVEAVIGISQPGAVDAGPPYVITSSTDASSGSVQLERTAELAVEAQAQRTSSEASGPAQLARLAFPAGLGPQAPLIADGIDAVTISAAGERPLKAAEAAELDRENVDAFARTAHAVVNALDTSPAPPQHGPGTHIELGDNLVPGWALSVLALTLLLPAAVAAVDAAARAARRKLPLAAGLAWAAGRSLPFVGALAALYGLALVGAIPRPEFPFDPGVHEPGVRAWICFFVIAVAAGVSAYGLRRAGLGAPGAAEVVVPALGVLSCAAVFAVWLANPYLGLLAVPAAHVWLLAAGDGRRRAVATVAAAVAAAVIVLAAMWSVSSALGLAGAERPWFFTVLVADGQLSVVVALSACFLVGALIGAVTVAVRRVRWMAGGRDHADPEPT